MSYSPLVHRFRHTFSGLLLRFAFGLVAAPAAAVVLWLGAGLTHPATASAAATKTDVGEKSTVGKATPRTAGNNRPQNRTDNRATASGNGNKKRKPAEIKTSGKRTQKPEKPKTAPAKTRPRQPAGKQAATQSEAVLPKNQSRQQTGQRQTTQQPVVKQTTTKSKTVLAKTPPRQQTRQQPVAQQQPPKQRQSTAEHALGLAREASRPAALGVNVVGKYQRAVGTTADAAVRHQRKADKAWTTNPRKALREQGKAYHYRDQSARLKQITTQRLHPTTPLKKVPLHQRGIHGYVPQKVQRLAARTAADGINRVGPSGNKKMGNSPTKEFVRRGLTKVTGPATVVGAAIDAGYGIARGEKPAHAIGRAGSTAVVGAAAGGVAQAALMAAAGSAMVPGPGWAVAGGIVAGVAVSSAWSHFGGSKKAGELAEKAWNGTTKAASGAWNGTKKFVGGLFG